MALRKFRKDCNKILRDSKFRARGTRNREPSVGKLLRSKSDQTKNVAKINMKYLDVDAEHYPHLAPDVCDRKCIKRCHSKGSASFVLLSLLGVTGPQNSSPHRKIHHPPNCSPLSMVRYLIEDFKPLPTYKAGFVTKEQVSSSMYNYCMMPSERHLKSSRNV